MLVLLGYRTPFEAPPGRTQVLKSQIRMDGSNRASHRLRFDRSWIAPLHVGDLTSFGSESGPHVGTFSGRNLESFVDFHKFHFRESKGGKNGNGPARTEDGGLWVSLPGYFKVTNASCLPSDQDQSQCDATRLTYLFAGGWLAGWLPAWLPAAYV